MFKKLHIDIETYSSIDINVSGAYKYVESLDFEILLVAYAFDDQDIILIDLASGEQLPEDFIKALQDPNIKKCAHNANFERQAFKAYGYDIPIEQWICTAVKAAYCGLPLSLEAVSKVLKFKEKGKLATGKALIRYFCSPIKPTKANSRRERNFYYHDLEKWEEFKRYCINDVEAERAIDDYLIDYHLPEFEIENYILDQKINDKGILIDLEMAQNAYNIDVKYSNIISTRIKELTGLENPNSPQQLKKWLSEAMGKEITTLAKDSIPTLLEQVDCEIVREVIELRVKSSKSSIKKYTAMLNCACEDGRAHGLFQFYGANRTGRWAGRLVQLQNLPQNHIDDLQGAREAVASGDFPLVSMLYDDLSSLLSQLIRTAFIAKPGHIFAVADFSAIEARVIAWLANEKWRLDVFNTHGKIYEASAAMMFGIPIEEITKGSDLRTKGKIAELALGYQGSLGALKKMGGEKMGLSESEMKAIVAKWRKANRAITSLWQETEKRAKQAIKTHKKVKGTIRNLIFERDGNNLTIQLPSGRKLFYNNPSFTINKFGQESIQYKGLDQTTKQWFYIDTYGGKLVENIVQAIARDILAYSMQRLKKFGFQIVMHVHDEVICEVPIKNAENTLSTMCDIMGQAIPWAIDLPSVADGYVTPFYKKD